MKTILKLTIAITFLLNLSSCEKVDDLSDVKFNTTLSENIEVNINPEKSAREMLTFDEEVVINLQDGVGDIHDYLNHIREIDVKEFQYEILSNNIDATITASMYVDERKVLDHLTINLNEAVQSAELFKVLAEDELNRIANNIETNKQITIRYVGEVDTEEPLSFTIKVATLLGITANPI